MSECPHPDLVPIARSGEECLGICRRCGKPLKVSLEEWAALVAREKESR